MSQAARSASPMPENSSRRVRSVQIKRTSCCPPPGQWREQVAGAEQVPARERDCFTAPHLIVVTTRKQLFDSTCQKAGRACARIPAARDAPELPQSHPRKRRGRRENRVSCAPAASCAAKK